MQSNNNNQNNNSTSGESLTARQPRKTLTLLSKLIIAVCLALLSLAGYYGFNYTTSPAAIRKPVLEHYHFRMQLIIDGKAVDFGSQAYQQGYSKDQCTAALPDEPIHFHDNADQITHIHWNGITGGMVLKNYGMDKIGGTPGSLGYRFDKGLIPKRVPIYGQILPEAPQNANIYVYSGNETFHSQKDARDWLNQDLETFFETRSNFPGNGQPTSLLDKLFPKVSAHGAIDDGHQTDTTTDNTQELERINNLIGNVVIFIQKDEPNKQAVSERFNKLAPLGTSTCGG